VRSCAQGNTLVWPAPRPNGGFANHSATSGPASSEVEQSSPATPHVGVDHGSAVVQRQSAANSPELHAALKPLSAADIRRLQTGPGRSVGEPAPRGALRKLSAFLLESAGAAGRKAWVCFFHWPPRTEKGAGPFHSGCVPFSPPRKEKRDGTFAFRGPSPFSVGNSPAKCGSTEAMWQTRDPKTVTSLHLPLQVVDLIVGGSSVLWVVTLPGSAVSLRAGRTGPPPWRTGTRRSCRAQSVALAVGPPSMLKVTGRRDAHSLRNRRQRTCPSARPGDQTSGRDASGQTISRGISCP